MLVCAVDFYHFIPLSLTWTLSWFHMVSTKQNLLASFSCTVFIWSGWNLMSWWSNSSWKSWEYFWVRCVQTKEIIAVLLTASKNLNDGMHSEVYESVWSKLGMIIDTVALYILILLWLALTLIQGHRSARKQKLLPQLSHKVFNQFESLWMYYWDLFVWWTLYSFYLVHSIS